MSALLLKIVTPEGIDQTIECDSVNLWMSPNEHGRDEGSIGIMKNHAEAVIAVGNGPLQANLNGKTVFSAQTQGGFATVLHNTVSVVSPHIEYK